MDENKNADITNKEVENRKCNTEKTSNTIKTEITAVQINEIIQQVFKGINGLFIPKWYKYFVDIIIILCVVLPITFLAYCDKLDKQILGTLFGGIIGYTLARFKKGIN